MNHTGKVHVELGVGGLCLLVQDGDRRYALLPRISGHGHGGGHGHGAPPHKAYLQIQIDGRDVAPERLENRRLDLSPLAEGKSVDRPFPKVIHVTEELGLRVAPDAEQNAICRVELPSVGRGTPGKPYRWAFRGRQPEPRATRIDWTLQHVTAKDLARCTLDGKPIPSLAQVGSGSRLSLFVCYVPVDENEPPPVSGEVNHHVKAIGSLLEGGELPEMTYDGTDKDRPLAPLFPAARCTLLAADPS